MIDELSNPAAFMRLSAWAMPLSAALAAILFGIGLPWALVWSPADYLQGETARIMYIHVPAAWWALMIYAAMGVASFIHLVFRHQLADLAARAGAPIGATFAVLCLITGSIWGRPTWGTWWEWDGRLTSMLILFIIYLGYLALRAAIEDETKGAKLAAILCLVGLINLPIIHFSVEWWSTLHQGSSVIRSGGSSMDPSMLGPLLVMAFAYLALAIALTFAGMRAEIFRRRVLVAQMRRARSAA
jgi:heme exporter protein C